MVSVLKYRPVRNLAYSLRATVALHRSPVYECPICGYRGRFLPYGDPPRQGALCRRCGSAERHRLLAMVIKEHRELLAGKHILHFAPEAALAPVIDDLQALVTSADLEVGVADTVIDIEDMATVGDASFAAILCSHVLEHVDDGRALAEMYRVLAPGGTALIAVPVVYGWSATYEDDGVTTPADRRRFFGQEDHVRYYGRDVVERVRDAGFDVMEHVAVQPAVARYSLERGDRVMIATKPPRPPSR